MRRSSVIRLLAYIKGVWQEQNTDVTTIDVWTDILAALDDNDVKQAVGERVQAGLDRPSCAQLYHEALEVRERRLSGERERRAKLEYRQSDEEHAANVQRFEEILAELTRKLGSRGET